MTMRPDPGPCIVCGAAFSACTHDGGAIVIAQLPARDAAAAAAAMGDQVAILPPALPLRAEAIQATLPPGQVTSGTYRRKGR